jgi:cytochrome c oxidase assembly protein subunit 15
MVKSGLADVPYVSHYRLAAHLGLAFLLLGFLFDLAISWPSKHNQVPARLGRHQQFLHKFANVLLGLIGIQVIYGAFVAGLKAGFSYNTFPKMGDAWIPDAVFGFEPWISNFFGNPAGVQFVHRCLAWSLFAGIILFAWVSRKAELSDSQRGAIRIWLGMLVVQFSLGVATILLVVPVSLGTLHQVGAALLMLAGLNARNELRKPARIEARDTLATRPKATPAGFQGPSASPSY